MPDMPQELERRQNARERVLAALLRAGPKGCTNVDLCQPHIGGLRAIGRVHELRRDWDIETRHEGMVGGRWRYILRGPRLVAPEPPSPPGWLF